jgi:hypothetical protein
MMAGASDRKRDSFSFCTQKRPKIQLVVAMVVVMEEEVMMKMRVLYGKD